MFICCYFHQSAACLHHSLSVADFFLSASLTESTPIAVAARLHLSLVCISLVVAAVGFILSETTARFVLPCVALLVGWGELQHYYC